MTGGLSKTPLAALSRPVAGVRGITVILTLPGSTKGATENLSALLPVLPHALSLARGEATNSHPVLPAGASSTDTRLTPHATCPHGHAKKAAGVALRPRASPYKMISVSEALELVLDHARALANKKAPEKIKLGDPALLGAVLAENATATEPVPAYPASIVDGYAVRSREGPGEYTVASCVSLAGSGELAELLEGTIARISTGAPVPRGADAVVMVEDTQLITASADNQQELTVRILGSVQPGDNIRAVGSDLAQGAIVLPKGYHINASGGALGSDLGLLASSGLREVRRQTFTNQPSFSCSRNPPSASSPQETSSLSWAMPSAPARFVMPIAQRCWRRYDRRGLRRWTWGSSRTSPVRLKPHSIGP